MCGWTFTGPLQFYIFKNVQILWNQFWNQFSNIRNAVTKYLYSQLELFSEVKFEKSFEKYNYLICEQGLMNKTIFSSFPCARITKIKETSNCEKVKWMFDVDWKRRWNESPTRAIYTHFQSQMLKTQIQSSHPNLSKPRIYLYILFIYKIHHASHKISLHISQMSPHNKFNYVIGYTRGGLPNAFCWFYQVFMSGIFVTIKIIQSSNLILMLICSQGEQKT